MALSRLSELRSCAGLQVVVYSFVESETVAASKTQIAFVQSKLKRFRVNSSTRR